VISHVHDADDASATQPLSADGVIVIGAGRRAELVADILASHGTPVERLEFEQLAPAPYGAVLVFTELTLLEAARALKQLGPSGRRPTALVVCDAIRAGEVRIALAGGIGGVVLADSLSASLIPTLAVVHVGQVAVPRIEARQIEAASLSTREKQILGLVVMGCPNGEIAERLVVAESTVKSHLSSAFGKLGVRSRNEAVDLILDSERGLGAGILGLESERIAS
jgi:DNA-binding NarL/FixJ family response regulator